MVLEMRNVSMVFVHWRFPVLTWRLHVGEFRSVIVKEVDLENYSIRRKWVHGRSH
jgi:hypothetical protein